MTFVSIFGMMLLMIAASIAVELVLPMAIKQRLGGIICWLLMAVTMSSLGLCTIGLLVATWINYIQPALFS